MNRGSGACISCGDLTHMEQAVAHWASKPGYSAEELEAASRRSRIALLIRLPVAAGGAYAAYLYGATVPDVGLERNVIQIGCAILGFAFTYVIAWIVGAVAFKAT